MSTRPKPSLEAQKQKAKRIRRKPNTLMLDQKMPVNKFYTFFNQSNKSSKVRKPKQKAWKKYNLTLTYLVVGPFFRRNEIAGHLKMPTPYTVWVHFHVKEK